MFFFFASPCVFRIFSESMRAALDVVWDWMKSHPDRVSLDGLCRWSCIRNTSVYYLEW